MQKQKPFKVFIRRDGGYETTLTVRFEVVDGHGILVLQKKGRKSEPTPTLAQEERDVTPKALKAGRFIHVLAGSGRRQSYALSRLAEELLARIPDDAWTELDALTEYGFRYLIVSEDALPPVKSAPATVAVPGNVTPAPAASVGPVLARARTGTPAPAAGSAGPTLKPATPGAAPSALQRAMQAIRSGKATDATDALRNTPRPAPTAKVSGGMVGRARATRSPAPGPDPDTLDHAAAIERVKELTARVDYLENKLAGSITREADLIEILARWQAREIEE